MANLSLIIPTFPSDAKTIVKSKNPRVKAIQRALEVHSTLVRGYGKIISEEFGFDPDYPFAKLLHMKNNIFMPKKITDLYWYLASSYTIAVEIHTIGLRTSVRSYIQRTDLRPAYQHPMAMLQWFKTLPEWDTLLTQEWEKVRNKRPVGLNCPATENMANPLRCFTILLLRLHVNPDMSFTASVKIHKSSEHPLVVIGSSEARQLEKYLFAINMVILDAIWPKPEEDAPWEYYPPEGLSISPPVNNEPIASTSGNKRANTSSAWQEDDSDTEDYMNLSPSHEPINKRHVTPEKNQPVNVDLFDAYFRRADLDCDGRIRGQEAVPFFQGSGLPKQVLAQLESDIVELN
ncbi:hypothetical protein F8388_016033 [Cannabis sativa]|uniref:EF-hand domain-containing protein n=1 Tax=Cannabis sativa TaxID=3483 RepID=A0A7J6FV36_CANSA|nr:hypothetical protein F8388_016033 [Cannabis sativa]